MKYHELLVEYKKLLADDVRLRQEMNLIPKGYLVTKKIAGKEYLYLQYTVQGKKKSEYVHYGGNSDGSVRYGGGSFSGFCACIFSWNQNQCDWCFHGTGTL